MLGKTIGGSPEGGKFAKRCWMKAIVLEQSLVKNRNVCSLKMMKHVKIYNLDENVENSNRY